MRDNDYNKTRLYVIVPILCIRAFIMPEIAILLSLAPYIGLYRLNDEYGCQPECAYNVIDHIYSLVLILINRVRVRDINAISGSNNKQIALKERNKPRAMDKESTMLLDKNNANEISYGSDKLVARWNMYADCINGQLEGYHLRKWCQWFITRRCVQCNCHNDAMLTHCRLVTPNGNITEPTLEPGGTKPVPEQMLTHHQWGPVTIIWGNFTSDTSTISS